MKKLKLFFVLLAASTLLFTSCSKEEDPFIPGDEKATLSFGAILNDLVNKSSDLKQQLDFPTCSGDAPAFVDIVLSGTTEVGSMSSPLRVSVNPTPGDYDNDGVDEYFTEEHADLELEPGPYSLDWFVVRNADLDVIWVAPIEGGAMANFVENALPLDFNLGAGVKKYVDVPVVCFDDRDVNEYGYQFFDVEAIETFTYCFFANYCNPDGRHYPAAYSVNIWLGTDATGDVLYSGVLNSIGTNDDGDAYASPLCLALPNLPSFEDDVAYMYYEVSLLDWEAVYGDAPSMQYSGTLSRADIVANFDGDDNVYYQHIRFGCGDDGEPPVDSDGDGVIDDQDNCPNTPPGTEVDANGCEITGECDPGDPNQDCDNDGVLNGVDNCLDTDPGVEVDQNGCEAITVPGRDIVVLNDANIFDAAAMEDPNNVRLVQNLINFTTTGSRNSGDVFMYNYQNTLGTPSTFITLWSEMRTVIEAEGYTISDTSAQDDLLNIPADVKVVMLVLPLAQYSVEVINSLKSFAAEGGRIIFMGEHEDVYGAGIPIENDFLISMGAVLRNTGGYVDCLETQGQPHIKIPSVSLREHPIMEGIDELSIACSSIIEPGADDFPLFYDSTNTHVLGGVAKIDVSPISAASATSINNKYRRNQQVFTVTDFLGDK